jgi:hypothetical protein
MSYRVVFSPAAAEQLVVVSIIGVFYGGQDYESLLSEESDEGPAH